MKFFGTRPTYQIFSGATFITGCIYYLFNKFYLHKKAVSDDNDLYKKKPTDIESREPKEEKAVTDGVVKNDIAETVTSVNINKLVADSTDGGSDSGVDNPAFDSETVFKKDETKATG